MDVNTLLQRYIRKDPHGRPSFIGEISTLVVPFIKQYNRCIVTKCGIGNSIKALIRYIIIKATELNKTENTDILESNGVKHL